jgi:hypothetical protein
LTAASSAHSNLSELFNATFIDPNDENIYTLSNAWKEQTEYSSYYPDSVRLDLGGFKSGPGL